VWDHEKQKKHSLSGDFLYPDLAILDANLTITLGKEDTLYPALDAISHALESLWNVNRTPVSRSFAFQALALINEALPLVIKEPQNLKARQHMQTASLLAGLAISQTRTAIAHAVSYPLTTTYGVPHGLACSFTLAKLISLNKDKLDISNPERDIISSSESLLTQFNLPEKVNNYVQQEGNLKEIIQKINEDRARNYDGAWSDIQTVIQELANE
jgi:alcohol dehydrogenase